MRIRIDAHSIGKVGFRLAAWRAHHQVAVGVSSIILCEPSVKKTFTIKYKKCLCGKKNAKSVSMFARSLRLLLVEKAVANECFMHQTHLMLVFVYLGFLRQVLLCCLR